MTPITDIPTELLYEELAGRPLYRKGSRDVLAGTKSTKDIMGSSSLQSLLVSLLHLEIGKFLPDEYVAVVSEPGLHIAHGSNVANDIAVFKLSQIERFDKKYFSVPPEFVIEVDVKADIDLSEYASPEDYIFHKTQTMLDFGVGTVIWITTEGTRKVLIAQPGQDWRVTNWESMVQFAPECRFSLQQLLERRGLLKLLD